MNRLFLPCLALLALCGGCATPREPQLPSYHWIDEDTALRDLRTRAEAVKTVSAECAITLSRADGDTIQFDGALAMRNPDWVRLRAWKFNRAVLDLTLQPAGLWVMTLNDPKRKDQVLPASVSAAEFIRQWSWFNGGMLQVEGLRAKVDGDTLLLTSMAKSDNVTCEVDRRTLTPRRYLYQSSGQVFELTLDGYRQINGVFWPTHLVARSPAAGTIVIEQRDVEINAELAPNAFVPPRRAEKRQ